MEEMQDHLLDISSTTRPTEGGAGREDTSSQSMRRWPGRRSAPSMFIVLIYPRSGTSCFLVTPLFSSSSHQMRTSLVDVIVAGLKMAARSSQFLTYSNMMTIKCCLSISSLAFLLV